MNKDKAKQSASKRRVARVRAKITGTAERPRLSVFRSNKNIFAQIIDDGIGKTLVSAHTREVKTKGGAGAKTEAGKELGKLLAERALEAKIKQVVFDRRSNLYHGRVKAVADGAREGGLEF